jgi:hypothetical protein
VVSLKVVQFPTPSGPEIAAEARKFADAFDRGEYGEATCALLIVDTPDCVWLERLGEVVSNYTAIGILETAKQHVISQILPA